MRLGRGDRRGAMRLALFILALSVLSWILAWPYFSFINLLLYPYLAVLTWIFYMAAEPFMRRRWPQVLVSWTRLLSGEWRDPLVARDTLIGIAAGIFNICIAFCLRVVPSQLFVRFDSAIDFKSVTGSRFTISGFLDVFIYAAVISLLVVCLLVILRVVLRNQKVAIAAFILITAMASLRGQGLAGALIFSVFGCFLVLRFGQVAALSWYFTYIFIAVAPITLQTTWYAPYGYLVLAIFGAIILYAFRFSLGSLPLFAPSRLDE
jgi:serine/threonine-protein kinase